jgi:hypothetical protein
MCVTAIQSNLNPAAHGRIVTNRTEYASDKRRYYSGGRAVSGQRHPRSTARRADRHYSHVPPGMTASSAHTRHLLLRAKTRLAKSIQPQTQVTPLAASTTSATLPSRVVQTMSRELGRFIRSGCLSTPAAERRGLLGRAAACGARTRSSAVARLRLRLTGKVSQGVLTFREARHWAYARSRVSPAQSAIPKRVGFPPLTRPSEISLGLFVGAERKSETLSSAAEERRFPHPVETGPRPAGCNLHLSMSRGILTRRTTFGSFLAEFSPSRRVSLFGL